MANSPVTSAVQQIDLAEFASALHAAESETASYKQATRDPGEAIGQFFSRFLETMVTANPSASTLVDHAVWRLLKDESLREVAIMFTTFLDPGAFEKEQAQLVAILGRFCDDSKVADFLQDIVKGTAGGLIGLNNLAVGKARDRLRTGEPSSRNIPTQEQDLTLFGLVAP